MGLLCRKALEKCPPSGWLAYSGSIASFVHVLPFRLMDWWWCHRPVSTTLVAAQHLLDRRLFFQRHRYLPNVGRAEYLLFTRIFRWAWRIRVQNVRRFHWRSVRDFVGLFNTGQLRSLPCSCPATVLPQSCLDQSRCLVIILDFYLHFR